MEYKELYMNLRAYIKCFEICDDVMKIRAGKTMRKKDYPAAVVYCSPSISAYRSALYATSGKVVYNSYASTPNLENELQRIGPIGSQSPLCDNYIGACAEPHAAHNVLIAHPQVGVKQLVFSYAFRPRTKMILPYCLNCKSVFNVQNP